MWLVRNSMGLFCVLFFYTIVVYVGCVTVVIGVVQLKEIVGVNVPALIVPYLAVVCMGVVMHAKCVLTDPGTVQKDSATDEQSSLSSFCSKCRCMKSHRAHHCSMCARCVMRMDHHCPWINNCVGITTQKHFLLFLFYLTLAAAYTIAVLAARTIVCLGHREHSLCSQGRPEFRLEVFLGVSALMISAVFLVFLLFMLYDQFMKVMLGTTGIERLQQVLVPYVTSTQRPARENLYEVCGGPFSFKWFLPYTITPPPLPLAEHELI